MIKIGMKWKAAQWQELKWWKRYMRGKDRERYLQWKQGYWNKILDMVKDYLPSGDNVKALDAGCGPAGIFISLPYETIHAVDPLFSRYMESGLVKQADYQNVRFFSCPFEEFSLDTKYDIIFCMNALNHFQDIHSSLYKMRFLLREGGTLVLTIDGHRTRFFKFLFRLLPVDVLHPHQYSLKGYVELLEKGGFKVDEAKGIRRAGIFEHWLIVSRRAC